MENITVIEKIKNHALNRVEKYISRFSIEQQQQIVNEMIRYYDQIYDSTLYEKNTDIDNIFNFIDFSFPIALRYLSKNYIQVKRFPLIPSTNQSIKEIRGFLELCFKAGIMENYEELIRLRVLKTELITEKRISLSYVDKNYSIERYEKSMNVKHSHSILIALENEYLEELKKLPKIIKRMEKLFYIWNHDFIGYDAHPEVDDFFIRNAQLDLTQATEWDGFSQFAKFGNIEYQLFLDTLVIIESLALKHLQFVEVAMRNNSNLKKINLLPLIVDYDVFLDSLRHKLNIPAELFERIFSVFVLDDHNKEYYNHIGAPIPLFIRISSTQLLRSFNGCVYKPVDFMLSELKRQYPKDWDRNTRDREQIFRNELYKCFNSENFMKFDRGIDIFENGRIITDIDACIIDKITGDMCFIQLKWQDSIYESTRSFTSKRKNYIEKSRKWINDMEQWINTSSEKKIADYLHVSPKLINKSKIKLFVIGRHNGNYSGNEKPVESVAWCQWYHFIELIKQISEEELSITKLFKLIQENNPYNQKNEIKHFEIKYGNYFIELVAPPFNQS